MSASAEVLAVLSAEIADISGLSSSTDQGEYILRERETNLRCARAAVATLLDERDHLRALINSPELENFLRAVHIEAVHQVERWGAAHDRAKRPADWFWLVGYLAGKALHAAVSSNCDKALHHCVSAAAALYNWHCAIKGVDVRMCPGRSDLAELVDGNFPGEAQS